MNYRHFKRTLSTFLVFHLLFVCCQDVSSCVENFEFVNFDEQPSNEAESKIQCERFNATLASITNSEELTFARDFLRLVISRTTYFGLERSSQDEVNDVQDPADFSFIDGLDFNDENDLNFAQIRGEDPWDRNRPDNSGGVDQQCVIFQNNRDLEWDDVSCSVRRSILCKRSCTSFIDVDPINDVEPVDNEDNEGPSDEFDEEDEVEKENVSLIGTLSFAILCLISFITLKIKKIKLKKTKKNQEIDSTDD